MERPVVASVLGKELSPEVLKMIFTPCALYKLGFHKIALDKLDEIVRDRTNPELLKEIERTNSWISGSFILQCIYDCVWKDSDLDIYEPVTYKEDTSFSDMENYAHAHYVYKPDSRGFSYSEYDPKMRIVQTRKYRGENGTAIDIVKVYECNTADDRLRFTKEVFDFDICKNMIWFENGRMCIYIHNWNDIVTKSTDLNFGSGAHIPDTMKRAGKYTERGITMRNNTRAGDVMSDSHKPKFTVDAWREHINNFCALEVYVCRDDRLKKYNSPGMSFRNSKYVFWNNCRNHCFFDVDNLCRCNVIPKQVHMHLCVQSDHNGMREDEDIIIVNIRT
jgi:hypothetical protein